MSTKNKLESQKQQQWQPNMCGPTLIVFDKECWLCYDLALESQGEKMTVILILLTTLVTVVTVNVVWSYRSLKKQIILDNKRKTDLKTCKEYNHELNTWYTHIFDAQYCKLCDEWLEAKCSDDNCEFCSTRPEKPSQMPKSAHEVHRLKIYKK